MNNTQKLYYRFKFEQKLPKCIQYNVKPVTIHKVINSKDPTSQTFRPTTHRDLKLLNQGCSGIDRFIIRALKTENTKLLRICYKHYKDDLFYFCEDVIPLGDRYIPNIRNIYKPFLSFKGYRYDYENNNA